MVIVWMQRENSMMTFEGQPIQGLTNIVQKLQVRGGGGGSGQQQQGVNEGGGVGLHDKRGFSQSLRPIACFWTYLC